MFSCLALSSIRQQEREARPSPSPPADPPFLAVINAYDLDAPAELNTTGEKRGEGSIHPPGWGGEIYYKFWKRRSCIVVQLLSTEKRQDGIADCLAGFDGREVADQKLTWHPNNRKLKVELPITLPPETIAKAMHDLIKMTKDAVTNRINEIRGDGAMPVAQ